MIKKLLNNYVKIIAIAIMGFGFNNAHAQYCVPAINCTDGDNILNVEFAGIDNPSACSPDGYGDFTGEDPAEVVPGESYDLSVEVGAGWSFETVGVWIDFDDNETFDIDEFFLIGTGSGSVVTAEILIPADAIIGTHRMRVSNIASDVPHDDPCFNDPGNFGEFEDYLVNVSDVVGTPDLDFSNSVSVFKNGQSLSMKAGKIIDNVEVYDLTGKLIAKQQNIASANATIELSATNQILLVKIQSKEGYTTTKKVVF